MDDTINDILSHIELDVLHALRSPQYLQKALGQMQHLNHEIEAGCNSNSLKPSTYQNIRAASQSLSILANSLSQIEQSVRSSIWEDTDLKLVASNYTPTTSKSSKSTPSRQYPCAQHFLLTHLHFPFPSLTSIARIAKTSFCSETDIIRWFRLMRRTLGYSVIRDVHCGGNREVLRDYLRQVLVQPEAGNPVPSGAKEAILNLKQRAHSILQPTGVRKHLMNALTTAMVRSSTLSHKDGPNISSNAELVLLETSSVVTRKSNSHKRKAQVDESTKQRKRRKTLSCSASSGSLPESITSTEKHQKNVTDYVLDSGSPVKANNQGQGSFLVPLFTGTSSESLETVNNQEPITPQEGHISKLLPLHLQSYPADLTPDPSGVSFNSIPALNEQNLVTELFPDLPAFNPDVTTYQSRDVIYESTSDDFNFTFDSNLEPIRPFDMTKVADNASMSYALLSSESVSNVKLNTNFPPFPIIDHATNLVPLGLDIDQGISLMSGYNMDLLDPNLFLTPPDGILNISDSSYPRDGSSPVAAGSAEDLDDDHWSVASEERWIWDDEDTLNDPDILDVECCMEHSSSEGRGISTMPYDGYPPESKFLKRPCSTLEDYQEPRSSKRSCFTTDAVPVGLHDLKNTVRSSSFYKLLESNASEYGFSSSVEDAFSAHLNPSKPLSLPKFSDAIPNFFLGCPLNWIRKPAIIPLTHYDLSMDELAEAMKMLTLRSKRVKKKRKASVCICDSVGQRCTSSSSTTSGSRSVSPAASSTLDGSLPKHSRKIKPLPTRRPTKSHPSPTVSIASTPALSRSSSSSSSSSDSDIPEIPARGLDGHALNASLNALLSKSPCDRNPQILS